jgi:BRCA1-associated protein
MSIEPGYWVHICLYSQSASTSNPSALARQGQFPRSLDEIQRKVDRPLDARFSPLTVEILNLSRQQKKIRKQSTDMPPKANARNGVRASPRPTPSAIPTTPSTPTAIVSAPSALSLNSSPTSASPSAANVTPIARFIKESSFNVDENAEGSTRTGPLEVSFGIVHLFRDDAALQDSAKAKTKTALEDDTGTILAILGVPSYIGPADFLKFIEPATDALSQVRMIREERAQRCMVLLKFREPSSAEEFHKMYADQPFDLQHDPNELCRVVYVTKVSISTTSTLPYAYPLLANSDPWPIITNITAQPSSQSESNAVSHRLASAVSVELPTCPVCLERMDASVTGLMTVTCQHTFHCSCLSRWSDSRCPVCRYTQSRMVKKGQFAAPSFIPEHGSCALCGTSSDLWVCLICAAVGCGRYRAGHAHRHYQETGHLFSLELETQRVWSYDDDSYIHRLIQNKAESKMMDENGPTPIAREQPLPTKGSRQMEASSSAMGQSSELDDKMEAIGLEYSNLLSTQLESQRAFYEDQVRVYQRKAEEGESVKNQTADLEKERNELKRSLEVVTSRYESAHRNLERSLTRIKALDDDLKGESLMNKGLMGKIEKLEKDSEARKQDIVMLKMENDDLKEQVRDLMVFLETRDTIEKEGGKDLRGGSVTVGKSSAVESETLKASKPKKKKGKSKDKPVEEGSNESKGEAEQL